jgi:hypothetical protein
VNDNGIMCRAEAYTASLDSALGLVDRVLGDDCYVMVERWGSGNSGEAAIKYGPNWSKRATAAAPTPALALLAALLKALSEKDQANG